MSSDERMVLRSGSGEVAVVVHGGRVAELRPVPEGPNLLWRGDVLEPLTGGDRLWLAPELTVFYPEGDTRRDSWRCPEELDPGSWAGEQRDGAVTLRQVALGATMTRTITALQQPPVATDLAWCGVRVDEQVETSRRLSGWHLTMVGQPATVFARGSGPPQAMYGQPPALQDGWLRAEPGPAEWKLGLLPPADGRAVLAALGDDDPGGMVVLLADVDPHGEYVDKPPSGDGPATALQLYSSPDGYGFCELEHHFPLQTRAATTVLLGVWAERQARLDLLDRLSAAPREA